jgi:aryl-alcohol dehydrogenase-like predicted oxidoreductase
LQALETILKINEVEKIVIGKTDLEVARINLGGNVFGWTINEQQSFEILDKFAGAGFNFIDTADVYSRWKPGNKGGESETIIGNWMKLRGNRKDLVIATKVGSDMGDGRKGLSAGYIKKAAEASLSRLQVDCIDLYYTHFDDELTPLEETLGAYADLIKDGKVRYIAASNMSPERLLASLALGESGSYPLYQALQPHYNLVEREKYESIYAPIARQYGLSVFPYYALASGFLTGKYRSAADSNKSVRGAGAGRYLDEKGLRVLTALDAIADKHNTQVATVALAWLLAQPNITAPVVSATSIGQLETLLAAPGLTLDRSDLDQLNSASLAK